MKLTGAQIIVKTLIEQGTDVVFGYPGGQAINIYDSLYENSDKIKHILTAHEQGASHAADGYARASGKVGVCIATSGPGATNLVTGIATAYLDSTPMIAITGNVPNSLIGRDSFQEVDIFDITLSITKHNYFVKDISLLADIIREAFQIAKSGRPGPVLIDVPKDVQTAVYEWEEQSCVECLTNENKCDLKAAIELVNNAKRPFVYCGGGVVSSNSQDHILRFAEKIDAPIGCSMMGLSAVDYNNERALGMQGMHGRYTSSKAMDSADLIVAVGARFSDRATGNKDKFSVGAKIIHIDVDNAEINKNITVSLGLNGDIGHIINELTEQVDKKSLPEWKSQIEQLRTFEKEHCVLKGDFNPYTIIDTVCDNVSKDTVVATDVGQHQMWVAQRYRFCKPRSFITSGGLGTMGFGMGAAIGASVATGCPAVLFTGDGSFGMNLNELATAVSNDIPLTIVIMNNGVLGMVRQWQTLFFDKHYSNTTLNRKTDFVKLAEAFGAVGFSASTKAELEQALRSAAESSKVTLIDCHIDSDEMVYPMLPPGGAIEDMILAGDK
ncbi:MAG: biosynthetic-type acetolactate synthase large subunit [bacterium]|nr:biosynthetic-type acetolactate synthase large subunit [bacterium]